MNKKAFTLIELLVVIAIIAMLLAIIMPALRAAKSQAQLVIDMTHLSGLTKAWIAYAENNKGQLVGGNSPGNTGTGVVGNWTGDPYYCWVDYPISSNGQYATTPFNFQDEIRGIENGLLFSYTGKASNYHCPADNRFRKAPGAGTTTINGAYRSYSVAGGARGGTWDATRRRYATTGANFQYVAVTKLSEIKSPGNKYVFVEEDDNRGLNMGPFEMDMRVLGQPSTSWVWVDVPAVWHFDRSSFGFADGHAEKHKWNDPSLIKAIAPGSHYIAVNPRGVDDFSFMLNGFPYAGLP